MYNPREDTVLFPAFRGIVSAHEFDSLGEDFEEEEDELFGDGLFKVVHRVAVIEKKLCAIGRVREKNKLRIFVDKVSDQPGASDAIAFDPFTRKPLHD